MRLNGQNFSDTLVAFVNIVFICVLLLEEERQTVPVVTGL